MANPTGVVVRQQNAGQNLTFGAASVTSTAFGAQTYAIRVSALTSNCHVRLGASAAATDMLIKYTDQPQYISVRPGETISVIQDSVTGTLNVVELTV